MICPECRGRGFAPLIGGVAGSCEGACRDDSYPERTCERCPVLYRGPAVYCCLECALADA
jgi:hypothetical protein